MQHLKKFFIFLLALSSLAGGTIAVIQLTEWLKTESMAEYNSPYIPLVYADVVEFRNFLVENTGRKVRFNTSISFDAVLPISLLAHEACNYDEFFESVKNDPAAIEKTDIGIIEFKDIIFERQNANYEEPNIDQVSCYDSMRIKMKDPSRLRFSYGGTGVISLPLEGLFIIEARYFSGPSIEYTLREI